MVYSLVYPENNAIAITPLSHLFGENTDYYTVFKHTHTFVLMIASYFFCQSCFVLGSSVWPKNSFIKTFSAGMIIFIAYVLIVVGFACLSAIAVLFTLTNWTLAYFRFKESEIINRM